ncbi:MAG: methyltransferase domain-containing protein [Vicinamibacterales bacterium]
MRLRDWLRGPPGMLPPRDAYARWAPTYAAAPHNALMAAEQRAVLDAVPGLRGRRVLDAGCGTGRYLEALADRGAARLVGLDASPEMLARVGTPGALRILGDLRALPVADASIDVAVSGLALNDVEDLGAALREIGRVLAPGGTLVYSVVHPRGGPLGWRRSFPTPQGTMAVRGFWHPLPEHERAIAAASLAPELVRHVGAPGAPDGGPVALVVRARKAS